MSKSQLQLPSTMLHLEDPKSPLSALSISPAEKDYLKPSIIDSQVVLKIGDFESPSPSPKNSLNYIDSPREKNKPNPTVPTTTTPQPNEPVSVLPNLRINFMRKVFAILFIQLLISGVTVGLTFVPSLGVRHFMSTNLPVIIVMALMSIGALCILIFKRESCRKVPRNYMLLFSYTIGTSYVLGSLAAVTESNVVLYAGGATLVVVLAISVYACTAKRDLTSKGMGFTTLFTTMLILVIVGIVLRGHATGIALSGVVAFAFGIHLTFNIQKLTGKYEVQYSLDDYIIASLDIYVDIVQIFVAILNIFRKLF